MHLFIVETKFFLTPTGGFDPFSFKPPPASFPCIESKQSASDTGSSTFLKFISRCYFRGIDSRSRFSKTKTGEGMICSLFLCFSGTTVTVFRTKGANSGMQAAKHFPGTWSPLSSPQTQHLYSRTLLTTNDCPSISSGMRLKDDCTRFKLIA